MHGMVAEGIEQGKRDNGVWAKAFADARGDEQEAKAIYIELFAFFLSLQS
tara:strand:- start:35 stop:184 length:150 start_codon:yes stop_codon:yes gene_type:complete